MKKINNVKNILKDREFVFTILLILFVSGFIFVNYNSFPHRDSLVKSYSLKITEITSDCEDCFSIDSISKTIEAKENIKIKEKTALNYDSKEAQELIKKYNIKTIPAVIINSKDIKKIGVDDKIFRIGKDYAVFDRAVPYFDLETKKVRGVVDIKELVDNNCSDCTSLSQFKTQFEGFGIKFNSYEVIDSDSIKGKELIKDNNLEFAPVLLLSKNIEEYWWVFESLKNYVTLEKNYYVFNTPVAPYMDLVTNKEKGKVDLIEINNNTCLDCFNVSSLKDSFIKMGVYFENEKTIDIESIEGKTMVRKYNITKIPTVILSNGINDYKNLESTLTEAGTIEKDGSFVFRNLDLLKAKYQNLE